MKQPRAQSSRSLSAGPNKRIKQKNTLKKIEGSSLKKLNWGERIDCWKAVDKDIWVFPEWKLMILASGEGGYEGSMW